MIMIPASVGELFDKIAILRIKGKRFADPEKKKNCLEECRLLMKIAEENRFSFPKEVEELQEVNERLWGIENAIRQKELEKDFGDEFVQLARRSFQTNEERATIKRRINLQARSKIIEEKEYVGYEAPK